MKYSQML